MSRLTSDLQQGGHMLTPLPGATPMKPGSAVSETSLVPNLPGKGMIKGAVGQLRSGCLHEFCGPWVLGLHWETEDPLISVYPLPAPPDFPVFWCGTGDLE